MDFIDGRCTKIMNVVIPRQIAWAFAPILGRPAWQVKQGHGSFLTLEFGEPRLLIDEPKERRGRRYRIVTIRGDWHLWVYCCSWDIFQDGERLAHSESDHQTIEKATNQLDGQHLEKLWIEPGTVATRFEFDLGGILSTFPFESDDDEPNEQWMLFEPSGRVVSIRSDNRFSYHPGNTPPSEVRWLPLLHTY